MENLRVIYWLKGTFNIAPELEEALMQLLVTEYVQARQIILGPGQKEDRLWYLVNGHARSYFYDQAGNQHTARFWKAGDLIFSGTGFYPVPVNRYIDMLENSVAVSLTFEHLQALQAKFDEVDRMILYFLRLEHSREADARELAVLPPGKRYLAFRKVNPTVFRVAPLRIIASYLQITRESLSRIMAKR